jgi:Family of unknown function (DUF6011)
MEGKLGSSDISNFVFAGKAIFTVLNTLSGNRFTFKVKKAKDKELYFISVLTGSNNDSDYQYIGFTQNNLFIYGKKSKIGEESMSVKTFKWFFINITKLPTIVEVFHKGNCGKCGKTLTTPESVKIGIGPFCLRISK